MLDLAAPIRPGVGAGGVELLDELRHHVGNTPPDGHRTWDRRGGEIVRFGPMTFTLRDGLVVGIGLAPGYTGTIDGRIGIGSSLGEAARVLGPIDTGDRVFRIAGRPGIGFDRTGPPPGVEADPDGPSTHPMATILGIVVWADVEPWVLF